MIFVTHFLDQVYQISDRITVLRNGQLVGTRAVATLSLLELVQMMLNKMFNAADLKRSGRPVSHSDPLVAFHQYGRRGIIKLFDLQAPRVWFRSEQLRIREAFIRLLRIRTSGPEQEVQYLSGSNQQTVLLSRWLATQPHFLILDEPTRGIDLGAHADIIRAIELLCSDGMELRFSRRS